MRDLVWWWRAGRVRKQLRIRVVLRNPLPALWRWLARRSWWGDRPEFSCASREECGRCYCRDGRSTTIHAQLFGSVLHVWINRDWNALPCSCDKIGWLLMPDTYAEEIEDYGLERLQAEFPGVEPVRPITPNPKPE